MIKEELINYLENQTAFLDLDNISEIFTSKIIGEQFNLKEIR